jgi:hypothetical protein
MQFLVEMDENLLNLRFLEAESRIVPRSIYFAHPVNTYGTDLEGMLLEKMGAGIMDAVENPNQEHHQENYQIWKAETGRGMDYFERLLNSPKIGGAIILPFEDGKIGAGVYREAEVAGSNHKTVFEINHDGLVNHFKFDDARKLSIEETRERVYQNQS